jgi:hypothetical protein
LIGHFFFLIVRIHSFLDFVFWLVFIPCGSGWGGDSKQIRWESVPTRHFWLNLSNKEA